MCSPNYDMQLIIFFHTLHDISFEVEEAITTSGYLPSRTWVVAVTLPTAEEPEAVWLRGCCKLDFILVMNPIMYPSSDI